MKVLYFMTTPPYHPAYTEMVKGLSAYEDFFRGNEIVWAAFSAVREQVKIFDMPVEVIPIPEPPYLLETIYNQLPKGWVPDILFFNNIDGIPLPENIWECSQPIAVIANDMHLASLHNSDIYDLVDAIAVISPPPDNIKKHKGALFIHCGSAEMPSDIPSLKPFSKRPVDILSICSKMLPAYMERNKTLGHIACNLGDKYNICFPSLRDLDIHTPHRFAKIVVDRSFLNVSGRACEAMFNGCLFFTHEENDLIANSMEPFVHYIPYNDNNIIDLLKEYLADEQKSQAVIDAATQYFADKSHTHGEVYNDYLAKAKEISNVEARINRVAAMSPEAKKGALATNLASYTTYWGIPKPKRWRERYYQLSNDSVNTETSLFLKAKRLLEAARVAMLGDDQDRAESFLQQLTELDSGIGWPWALRSRIAMQSNRQRQAMEFASNAIKACHDHPEKTRNIGLPLSVDQDWLQWLAWVTYMQGINPLRAEDQVRACLAYSYKVRSNAHKSLGDDDAALADLTESVRILPLLRDHVFELVCMLQDTGQLSKALTAVETGLTESPYSYMLLGKKVELQKELGEKLAAEATAKLLDTVKKCYSRDFFFSLTGLALKDLF